MSFQPLLPSTGIAGWNFLQATYDKQFEVFTQDAVLQRESDYFLENIGNVKSAADLISDPRLLDVALGAFGLEEDSYKKAFLERILQEGTEADDALANRMDDARYVQLSDAFGFGPGQSLKTGDLQAMTELVSANQVQAFETAVGEQDPAMRTAMFAERELAAVAGDDTSVDTQWFNVMAQPALREMFELSLNLPSSIGQIDIDQQLTAFKDRANAVFGSDDLSGFSDPEQMDKLITRYLAMSEISQFDSSISSGSTALLLLQG
ncbi:flagellar protein [Leisingera sp. ANG-M1]|uniref:DUF1217 domain-containing protein n=1 Tax=Leisingera sp. ANG-M1 TaxID=1577895 RepID=UPI00057D2959|nr:DUF1217 domain-containing protein [Leisingera sp. ANG-M1]KIC10368.1 flagellar protein [Leisingera sp. ANG-M1]